ncbi:GTPase ObgE [candidate division WWE3 bacterium]|nr:GTPase ObgE [candidate division WWE3 bacterium]
MLIDKAKIQVKAGDGGDGHVSFKRAKFIPKGGPDGGDGGDGGDVYIVATHNMATLRDFRAKPLYEAGDGARGGKKKCSGKDGEDLEILVPVGTLVYEARRGEDGKKGKDGELLVGDLVESGQSLLICRGGVGGKGNWRFRSSTNQAPRQFTKGTKGEEKELLLEIKMIADIGLVGLPNAGKSTLINQLTKSNAKTASYPFTTLSPNLGVLELPAGGLGKGSVNSVLIADIPGLIEGASKGKGLGDEFLRHVERTRLLVHVIDPFGGIDFEKGAETVIGAPEELATAAWDAYKTIRAELADYSKELAQKKEIVVINKLDITEVKESFEAIVEQFAAEGVDVLGISAVTGEGVEALQWRLAEVLPTLPERRVFTPEEVVKTYNLRTLPNRRVVFGGSVVEEG